MFARWGKSLLMAGAAAAVVAAASPAAQAGMIPVNVSVQPDGSDFRWTYGVIVTTDVRVKPGDSFTIYDISGMVSGSVVAPTGWSVAVSAATAPRPGTSPNDDPHLPDLTFTFTGTTPIEGQAGLGNFSVISHFGSSATSDFTSTAHRQVDGIAESNITGTDVPAASSGPAQTPEPASLALLGLGLPLAGLGQWLRRRLGR